MDSSANPPVPPIIHRSRHQYSQHGRDAGSSSTTTTTRRRSLPGPAASARRSTDMQPASPEVISSLISSLSVISKPADRHFEGQSLASLSLPTSPRTPSLGSFGVDYGAFTQQSPLEDLREEGVSLDELPASSPVIRTAKPPSGFSPLTAPKSPREPNGGFRSLMRGSGSRPSSKGSLGSRDDAQSIGNLSVERAAGVPSSSETNRSRSRSRESWGRKQPRSHRGLMYMSSKERLREKELERKRASIGAVGGGTEEWGLGSTARTDPILAETPISEEPAPTAVSASSYFGAPSPDAEAPASSPRPIPARDSSLRKVSSAKRPSARSSRTKRDGESGQGTIAETEEHVESRGDKKQSKQRSWHSRRAGSPRADAQSPSRATSKSSQQALASSRADEMRVGSPALEDPADDGAPFPAVSQGRRRDDGSTERSKKRSGRQTPEPGDAVGLKRSSSRLKRLSASLSAHAEGEADGGRAEVASPDPVMPAGYERPVSADSVDDAVESYLCSPRLSQKIKHPQTGRVISFSEVGDPEGSAVFCCVGMGLTRYITAFYDELALTLKLRLITPDRPGIGDSESFDDGTATPLGWPDDVYAICQALKITKFSILAHSAGAIYALATALRMPQHIRGRIHLLAPWIPPSQMSVFGGSQASPPTNAIPTSQRILRALPTPILKAANSSFMTATSSSITSSLPKTPRRKRKSTTTASGRDTPARRDVTPSLDKENLGHGRSKDTERDRNEASLEPSVDRSGMESTHRRPAQFSHEGDTIGNPGEQDQENAELAAAAYAMADKERQQTYDSRLTHAIWDLATTGANPAVDLLVCLERRHTIGFRYVDITRPVVIHHGSRDTRVPVENVKWLGRTMRRCEVRVLEGEGHGLMASAGVMGSVLMEMSKEWEDWMRVTGHSKREERGRKSSVNR